MSKAKKLPKPKPGFYGVGFCLTAKIQEGDTLRLQTLVSAQTWHHFEAKLSAKWEELEYGVKREWTRKKQLYIVYGVHRDSDDLYAEAEFCLADDIGWRRVGDEVAFENL